MQEIKHFGSVTVIVSGTTSAVVLSHQPEELHEHQDDWNQAVRWLVGRGFEAPPDDPDFSSPQAGETYMVKQAAHAWVGV